ncbi:MAG: DUF4157 domain-containing protein [Planctomycetaceae bacterium]|nr:DUF4157 domain-containing protein [Planctomycetaceae bacterium]
MEQLSGLSMSNVRVHYNSAKPAQLNALAYAQGTDIHLAPGQERHLPHEGWHVVQQMQGRVRETNKANGVPINDSSALEREADIMGSRARQLKSESRPHVASTRRVESLRMVQRVKDESRRIVLDTRMDQLRDEARRLLEELKKADNSFEQEYEIKGREKAERATDKKLPGDKKFEEGPGTKRQVLVKLWGQLSPNEKLELAAMLATVASSAVASLSTTSPERDREKRDDGHSSRRSTSSNSGKSSEKQQEEGEQNDDQMRQMVMKQLSQLTIEDLKRLCEVYRTKQQLEKKFYEARDKIIRQAGSAGGRAGATAGRLRDEHEFNKQVQSLLPRFKVARTRLELIESAIRDNEDDERYQNRLDRLHFALVSINGPAMVYMPYSSSDEGRADALQMCDEAIQGLDGDWKSVSERIGSGVRGATAAVVGWIGGKLDLETIAGSSEHASEQAREALTSQLETLVRSSWSKITKRLSLPGLDLAPSGVEEIRKILESNRSTVIKLEEVKKTVEASLKKASPRRHSLTQIFYQTLAKVDLANVRSINVAMSTIEDIQKKLKDG